MIKPMAVVIPTFFIFGVAVGGLLDQIIGLWTLGLVIAAGIGVGVVVWIDEDLEKNPVKETKHE